MRLGSEESLLLHRDADTVGAERVALESRNRLAALSLPRSCLPRVTLTASTGIAVLPHNGTADVQVVGTPGLNAGATTVDRYYSVGQKYLFIPFAGGEDSFQDNDCTLTQPSNYCHMCHQLGDAGASTGVAQLVERDPSKVDVASSSLVSRCVPL